MGKSDQQGFGVAGVIVAVLVVAAAGGAGWYVWQEQNKKAEAPATSQQPKQDEQQAEAERQSEQKQGTFKGLGDKTGSGTGTLVKTEAGYKVVLEDNFEVQSGPALYVSFGNQGRVDKNTLFAELKEFKGMQEYEVPATINPANYSELYIYCEEFSVPFSVAKLN